jgi:hypothetical protein
MHSFKIGLFLPLFAVGFQFAWYDLWIGAFWNQKKRRLLVQPLPCLGIYLDLG